LLENIFDPNNYIFWILVLSILAVIIFFVLRSFSVYYKFVYPNAKFEAMGNPFITEKELSRIAASRDITNFKELLNTSKDYNVTGDTTYELQRSLEHHFIQTIDMMRKDSSKKMNDFYDMYLEKLDSYLIKNVLKKRLGDEKIDGNIADESTLQTTKKFLSKLIDSKKEDIPLILKNHGFSKEVIDVFSAEKTDFLALDTAMDKHIINRFNQLKVPRKCEKAKQKFVNYLVDTVNIKNVLRAKHLGYDRDSCNKLFLGEGQEIADWKFKQMCEADSVSEVISTLDGTSYYHPLKDALENYNKEKSVQILENALDVQFLKLVRDVSVENYITIGPTLRFIVSKEIEIKNLKIIVKGIAEGFSTDLIQKFVIMENGS
jgi:V/A-type H+-transporting ATPase subunit C